MLLRGCRSPQPPGAACAGAVEGAARGCGSTASGKLHLALALGARAGWSAIHSRSKSASSPAIGTRGRSRSRDISGQAPSRAPPRRLEHHQSLSAS
jgi:hypothetical protein